MSLTRRPVAVRARLSDDTFSKGKTKVVSNLVRIHFAMLIPPRKISFAVFLLGTVLSFFEVFAWVFVLIESEPRVTPRAFR